MVLIRFLSRPFKTLSKWHLTFIAFFRYKLLKRIAWCHIQFLQGSSSKQEICLWSWDFWRIKVEEPEVIELWEHHLEASIVLTAYKFESNNHLSVIINYVNFHLTYKNYSKEKYLCLASPLKFKHQESISTFEKSTCCSFVNLSNFRLRQKFFYCFIFHIDNASSPHFRCFTFLKVLWRSRWMVQYTRSEYDKW